ncbi:hypothetical protein M2263_004385 [Providencia alcalifaciens]|nr:hypothetical protein [Providencia alcalifaciens]
MNKRNKLFVSYLLFNLAFNPNFFSLKNKKIKQNIDSTQNLNEQNIGENNVCTDKFAISSLRHIVEYTRR